MNMIKIPYVVKERKGASSKKVLRKSSVTFCYYLKSYQFDPNLIFTDELSVLNKSFKRECFVASPVYLDLLVCLTEPYLWVRKSQVESSPKGV